MIENWMDLFGELAHNIEDIYGISVTSPDGRETREDDWFIEVKVWDESKNVMFEYSEDHGMPRRFESLVLNMHKLYKNDPDAEANLEWLRGELLLIGMHEKSIETNNKIDKAAEIYGYKIASIIHGDHIAALGVLSEKVIKRLSKFITNDSKKKEKIEKSQENESKSSNDNTKRDL